LFIIIDILGSFFFYDFNFIWNIFWFIFNNFCIKLSFVLIKNLLDFLIFINFIFNIFVSIWRIFVLIYGFCIKLIIQWIYAICFIEYRNVVFISNSSFFIPFWIIRSPRMSIWWLSYDFSKYIIFISPFHKLWFSFFF
jgi:hypothetical protein